MALVIEAQSPPIALDDDGVARVGGTRVTLDTIVAAFLQGATAEEISYQYPVLSLSEIYAVISYYLSHREQVDVYLQSRDQLAAQVRRKNESRFDAEGVRERLLARKRSTE